MNICPNPFVPAWNLQEGDKRLLFLAAHLDRADERHIAAGEPTYDQGESRHPCGTPACAIGHSAALYCDTSLANDSCLYSLTEKHLYSLTEKQWLELFGYAGCGRARTAKEAAAYIRWFVARRSA